jgi:cbb3-type cytochrome oxidase subunit 3
MTLEHENGTPTPAGVALAILKKDGLLGLFLCLLCYFIWADKADDRMERDRAAALQKEMFDSLTASHKRETMVTIQAVEALRTTSAAVDNTRKALQYVERYHHRAEREN